MAMPSPNSKWHQHLCDMTYFMLSTLYAVLKRREKFFEESICQQKFSWKFLSVTVSESEKLPLLTFFGCLWRIWHSPAELYSEPNLLFATCSHPRAVSARLFVWRVNLGSWFGWKVTVSVRLFSVSLAAWAGLHPGWTDCFISAGEGQWRNEELLLQLPLTAAHGALHGGQHVVLTQCEKQFESTVFTEFGNFILVIH